MPAPGQLVHQQTTTAGTGPYTLSSVFGRQTFSSAFGTGGTNTFDVVMSSQSASQWMRATAHLSATNTLVIDTVKEGSNGTSAVNFSAGTIDVMNDIPAANQVYTEGSTVTDGDVVVYDQTTGRKLKTSSTSIATLKSYTGAVNALIPPTGYTAAVGDGVTDDTVAIQALLTNFQHVYLPGGKTYLTKNLAPVAGHELFGDRDATIVKFSDTSNLPNGAVITPASNCTIRDFLIQMDQTVYTNGIGIFLGSVSDCKISNIGYDGAGAFGVYGNGATRCVIEGLHALTANGGKQLVLLQNSTDCDVYNCRIKDGSLFAGNVIETTGCTGTIVRNNRCDKSTNGMFIVHTFQGLNEAVLFNIFTNSRREAIAFNGNNNLIHGNILYWANSTAGGDFGISCEGQAGHLTTDGIVSDNLIIGSALSGIGVPGYTARLLITGNKIVDACMQAAGNPFDSGIRFYGPSCSDHVCTGNDIVKVSSTGLAYGIREDAGITTNRCVNNRLFGLTSNVFFSDTGDTGSGPAVFANSPVFGGNARFKHNAGTGAGFWFDSPSASQRIFFGQDAATADFFRIYGVAFGNNVLGVNTATADISALGKFIVGAPTYATVPTSSLDVRGNIASSSPVTKTGTSGSVGSTDGSLIINASGTFTLTLPTASACPGRWLHIKSIAAQAVNSASSNVVPLTSGTAGTAILAATAGKWVELQSDGTNWVAMAGN